MDRRSAIGGFAGVVLAGGKNRRMGGKRKAFINVDGRPIIESTLLLFQKLFDEIVVVINSPDDFSRFAAVRTTPDLLADCGPAGGIHAGLTAMTAPMGFFVACDMPFLDENLIRRICSAAQGGGTECVISRSPKGIEPLHAVYAKSLAARFEKMLMAGTRKIEDVIQLSRCEWFPLYEDDRRALCNINAPADLAALLGEQRPADE